MSGLGKLLRGGNAVLHTVSGALFGSGSLAIPAGATLVTLTGRGGSGGNDSWYDPGQAFVAPVAAYWSGGTWSVSSGPTWTGQTYGFDPTLPAEFHLSGVACGDNANGTTTTLGEEGFGGGIWYTYSTTYTAGGGTYHAAVPGQSYIAPSSGGGIYSGANTTATLNAVTDTWAGGSGGVGTESIQTLASTGAGQTLTYSVGSGGALSYSYTY